MKVVKILKISGLFVKWFQNYISQKVFLLFVFLIKVIKNFVNEFRLVVLFNFCWIIFNQFLKSFSNFWMKFQINFHLIQNFVCSSVFYDFFYYIHHYILFHYNIVIVFIQKNLSFPVIYHFLSFLIFIFSNNRFFFLKL